MNYHYKKSRTTLLLVGICFLFILISNLNREVFNEYTSNNVENDRESYYRSPKTSGYWDLHNITIDGIATGVGAKNWTWAVAQQWCSGSGTLATPYRIENITIDPQSATSGIYIRDSSKYFIVNNCTIYNSSSAGDGAGIRLENVDNGTITNNNISENNNYGIFIKNGSYNIISENKIINNTDTGIYLNADWGTVSNNNINNNIVNKNEEGIILVGTAVGGTAMYNKIWNNTINENDNEGIRLRGYAIAPCSQNNVSENTINNSIDGLYLIDCEYNLISKNIVNNSKQYGIRMQGSTMNDLIDNVIENSADNGFHVVQASHNNTIKGNLIKNNNNFGIFCGTGLGTSSDNTIYNNYFLLNTMHADDEPGTNHWNSSMRGNYWANYSGLDNDMNGIGDTPHYFYSNYDYLPKTKPIIKFELPRHKEKFGVLAPLFNLLVDEPLLDTIWYSIGNGPNKTITSTRGYLDQALWQAYWDTRSHGDTIVVRFYINDSLGLFTFYDMWVTKYDPPSDSADESSGAEAFNILNIAVIIIAAACGVVIVVGVLYRKQLNNRIEDTI